MAEGCPVCRKRFRAKNYWQKYCSARCKQAAWAVKVFDEDGYQKKLTIDPDKDIVSQLDGYVPDPTDIYKVKIRFSYPHINKLYSKTKASLYKGDLVYCPSVPDLDNAVQPILNRLTGIVWKDDSRVVELLAQKFYDNRERTAKGNGQSPSPLIIVEVRVY